jgi:putative ABC transport system substrate-binding protein
MNYKIVAWLLTTLVLATVVFAEAQQTAKFPRIGRLGAGFPVRPLEEALRQGLRDLGYIEGQNIVIEYRYAQGKIHRLTEFAAELVQKKVDVIVAGSDPSVRAAHQATSTIPIVLVQSGGAIASGLIESLAHPGGNITGVTSHYPESRGKTLELFKEAFPKLRRLAMVWNPSSPGHIESLKEIEKVARALDVQLQWVGVHTLDDFENAFAEIIKGQANGLYILNSPFVRAYAAPINNFTEARRLPTIYHDKLYVEGGGLMSYGADVADKYRRAAAYVDKILKGAKPADLPVERSTKFELVINLQTAKKIGVTIPRAVLMDADRVIR